MIAPDVIRRIADEVIALHAHGCRALVDGDVLTAQLRFSLANVKLQKLQRLLDEQAKPLRKLCLVGDRAPVDPDDAELPDWFHTKANDNPDGAA